MNVVTAAPFLPMSRAEMEALGWDTCDIMLVTGDAYVDHPSFGMALIGRLLEAQGFRVGIIASRAGRAPNRLSRARHAGAVLRHHRRQHGLDGQPLHVRPQSMRSDDAYTPRWRRPHARPDRSVVVYAQRVREAFARYADRHRGHRGQPAAYRPLRLLVRQGATQCIARLKADLLVFGNGERQMVAISHRLAAGSRSLTSGPARHGLHAQGGAGGMDRSGLDTSRYTRSC
jgi:radical SAM superfamily enzyme YgiQ (UPF0313 family)